MGSTFRRMNTLAYQLEQAYAEGILNNNVKRNILDALQDYIEMSIQKEQNRQLQEWQKTVGQLIGEDSMELTSFTGNQSEEDIIYEEFIKTLPEGL
ncbi:MAG TPA: hypothetical protein PLP71_06045 [Syntrophomonadaceae bacterium]|nr:hypothetical protein [Syntrophomonadaceae bacterium]HQD90569.1 hypothetical protein [Syntrophomonadaceae bacterium]